MTAMRNTLMMLWILLAPATLAQQVVAPTPDEAGTPRGSNTGDYNVMDSFETGYRFAQVSGNLGTYHADLNYGNGIRLLSGDLAVYSRDGHGRWFDQIVLNTIGLGNDPYQSATLRVEKNRLYRYDLLWRLDDYFNPGLTVAAGEHFMDTSRRMQDHNLTLFPQSKIQFRLGYSRDLQDGPALSTAQLFTTTGNVFPVFENIRREQDEYRLGAAVELAGFKLTVMHSWVYFKEDSGYQQDGLVTDPQTGVTLTQFQRSEPYHGSSPYWLGNLTKSGKNAAVNARVTYVAGKRNFILDENAFGVTPVGSQNQQVFAGGDASRPELTGDLSLSFFPGTRLTLVNNTSINSTRIDGTSDYGQFDLATQSAAFVSFRYLGLRTIANATDLHYRVRKWLAVYGGYHYSERRIRDIEDLGVGSPPLTGNMYEQTNHLQEGVVGVRLKPVEPLTVNLEGEIGRADRPFTPVSDRNYQALGGRVEYHVRKLTFDAAYRENYNNNSVTLTAYSSHARTYSANASWAPRDWLALDAGYEKLHLDALSGIAFFAGSPAVPFTSNQVYISNVHAANLTARFVLARRVDLYVGYSITRDTGDGRANAAPAGATDPTTLVFTPVQTFPLNYQSPMARVSVRLRSKLRWNAGWQFYNYHEDFGLFSFYQGYHANTGYSSLTWAF